MLIHNHFLFPLHPLLPLRHLFMLSVMGSGKLQFSGTHMLWTFTYSRAEQNMLARKPLLPREWSEGASLTWVIQKQSIRKLQTGALYQPNGWRRKDEKEFQKGEGICILHGWVMLKFDRKTAKFFNKKFSNYPSIKINSFFKKGKASSFSSQTLLVTKSSFLSSFR